MSYSIVIIEGVISFFEWEFFKVEVKRYGVNYFFNVEYFWFVFVVGVSGENFESLVDDLNWFLIYVLEFLLE